MMAIECFFWSGCVKCDSLDFSVHEISPPAALPTFELEITPQKFRGLFLLLRYEHSAFFRFFFGNESTVQSCSNYCGLGFGTKFQEECRSKTVRVVNYGRKRASVHVCLKQRFLDGHLIFRC